MISARQQTRPASSEQSRFGGEHQAFDRGSIPQQQPLNRSKFVRRMRHDRPAAFQQLLEHLCK